MRQCLLVLLLALGATQVCAQRVLSLPDLSALTGQVGTGGLSVDPRSGSIYVTRSSRVSGMKSNGLARLVNGVPDLSWRPAVSVRSAPVFALNGNVYFVGQTADSGNSISVVSVATAASSAPVVRFTPVGAAALPGSGPLQAIAGGYDHWLYFTVRESFGVGGGTSRIGRLDTRDHTVDGWTYEVTGGDAFPVVGPDGSVYVVASSFQFDGETTRTITRLTTGAVAQRVWQRELLRATPRIEGDTQGRLYVMTRGASGPSAGIVRITAEGALDPSWSAWLVDAFFSQSTSARGADMRVVQGGLVATVAAEGATTEATFAVARVDEKGDISALTTVQGTEVTGSPYEAFYSRRLVGATSDVIYFANLRTITLLDPLTLRQKRAFAYVMGQAAEVVKVLALPDGGRLLLGRFDAFYGGRRYRDVLRTGADGNVVQDWQLAVEGTVDDIFLTPRGIVLFGRMTKANGVLVSNGAAPSNGYFRPSAALVSLAPGAAVDPTWGAQLPTTGFQLAYDGADTFFVASSVGANAIQLTLQTLSVTSNAMSTAWSVPIRGEWANLDTDPLGGLWLFWEGSGFGGSMVYFIERLDLATRTQTVGIRVDGFSLQARSLLSTRQHAYITDQRFALTQGGVADPSWRLRSTSNGYNGYPVTLSANYVYWQQSGVLRRSPLTGNGDADPAWSASLPLGAFTKYPQPPLTDDIEYVSYAQADRVLVATRNLTTENKTVIEYFNRDVGRFFLTGRTDEQDALDARPASFARTGMQFQARGTQAYSDEQSALVCRMYAAPDRGGSNTHFYGTGDDCAVLNTLTALRFEGFDFAAIKPSNGTCPASAASHVYRLFNNQSASNQANHRYAVSLATKSRMIAQGWVDEGVVFCSTNVLDAAN